MQIQNSFLSHISNLHIKKRVWGFIWPGPRNSLWSTKPHSAPKDETSDFFYTLTFQPLHSDLQKVDPMAQTEKPPFNVLHCLWKKNDLIGRMTTEEGVTLSSISVGLYSSSSPILPGTTNSVLKSLPFFLHCERERNELKRNVISKAPSWDSLLRLRPAFVPKFSSPNETQLFHGCLLSPTKWLPLCHLLRTPRLATHDSGHWQRRTDAQKQWSLSFLQALSKDPRDAWIPP